MSFLFSLGRQLLLFTAYILLISIVYAPVFVSQKSLMYGDLSAYILSSDYIREALDAPILPGTNGAMRLVVPSWLYIFSLTTHLSETSGTLFLKVILLFYSTFALMLNHVIFNHFYDSLVKVVLSRWLITSISILCNIFLLLNPWTAMRFGQPFVWLASLGVPSVLGSIVLYSATQNARYLIIGILGLSQIIAFSPHALVYVCMSLAAYAVVSIVVAFVSKVSPTVPRARAHTTRALLFLLTVGPVTLISIASPLILWYSTHLLMLPDITTHISSDIIKLLTSNTNVLSLFTLTSNWYWGPKIIGSQVDSYYNIIYINIISFLYLSFVWRYPLRDVKIWGVFLFMLLNCTQIWASQNPELYSQLISAVPFVGFVFREPDKMTMINVSLLSLILCYELRILLCTEWTKIPSSDNYSVLRGVKLTIIIMCMLVLSEPIKDMIWGEKSMISPEVSTAAHTDLVRFILESDKKSLLVFEHTAAQLTASGPGAPPLLYAMLPVPNVSAFSVSNLTYWNDALTRLKAGTLLSDYITWSIFDAVIIDTRYYNVSNNSQFSFNHEQLVVNKVTFGSFDVYFRPSPAVYTDCEGGPPCLSVKLSIQEETAPSFSGMGNIILKIASYNIGNPVPFSQICDRRMPGMYDKRWLITFQGRVIESSRTDDLRSFWPCTVSHSVDGLAPETPVNVMYAGSRLPVIGVLVNGCLFSALLGWGLTKGMVRR